MTAAESCVDDATLSLQLQQFLDEWHYRVIHSSLATSWDRPRATEAALELFALHGMEFGAGEQTALSQLEEHELINWLVAKMPEEFKRQFEHFALQLQLIVSTATRVRTVVQSGDTNAICEAMEHSDASGIITQILKQSITQAGAEVAEIRQRHTSWVKNTDTRLHRLVHATDEASQAQVELRKLQDQLGGFGGAQNAKSKKMLAGVAANNTKAMMATVFSGWFGFQQKMKSEKGIRDKFEAEIAHMEEMLQSYKTAQLNNVRSVLLRAAAEGDEGLMKQVWKAWADEVQETKRVAGSQEALKAMEAKLANYASDQAANTKKVMARMSAGTDGALSMMVMQAWVQALEEIRREKAIDEEAKAKEEEIKEFLAKKKDETRGVLDRMQGSSDTGLLTGLMVSWVSYFKEEQASRAMEEAMAGANGRFASLNGGQKENAMGVQERTNEQIAMNCMLRAFSYWALDCKLERVMRYYNNKMDSKKNQLKSVQHLFKNFANQLDQGLKEGGADSGRRKDGQVVLPDINAKRS